MRKRLVLLLLLLIVLMIPFLVTTYTAYLIGLVLAYGIGAVGQDLLMGYAGQASFGQAGFVAVGAYTTAFLVNAGLSYWVSFPIGGILAAFGGLVIGVPSLRLRGYYLNLATMCFAYVIYLILIHWENVTGGPRGLVATRPTWPFSLTETKHFCLVIIVISIALYIAALNIVKSRYGRAFLAVQKDEIVSKSMGINLTKYKTLAFLICSFYAGIAGGLLGPLIGFLDPSSFTILDSAIYIEMIVLGGRGTIIGGVIGALIFTILPEILREVRKWQELAFSVIFLGFLIYQPNGVMGIIGKYRSFFIEQISWMRFLKRLFEEKRGEEDTRLAPNIPFFQNTSGISQKAFGNGLLQVRNVSINFGGLRALNDVSFSIAEGQIFSLIGPNGAGKTTALNVITRLYEPSSGSIIFRDEELLRVRADKIIHKRINRTFQNVGLFAGLSTLENVMVGLHSSKGAGFWSSVLKLKGARDDETSKSMEAMEILKLVNLEGQAYNLATALPYGQQKLVGLARALISRPALLILDEPASGLSPVEIEQLMALIRRLCDESKITILLVEHDMRVVMGVSDHIAVLNFGQKIAEGEPGEIRDNPLVVEAYLGDE